MNSLGMANLYADTRGERRAYRVSVGAACVIHIGSVLLLSAHPPPPRAAAMAATEVELALSRPPPPPPPPPEEPPPKEEPPPEKEPPAVSKPQPAPRPKAAARAKPAVEPTAPPPLLTAAEDPHDAAPVRFASDPNGRSYSSGLVAAGAPPQLAAAPTPKPASDGITPADQLERQPMWRGDDCRGYFPDQAQTDLGRVALIAVVRPDGSIAKLDVASETPPGQGFAKAARACIQNQHFAPALDKKGRPTTARTQIALRFSR